MAFNVLIPSGMRRLRRQSPRLETVRRALLLLAGCALAGSCGSSRASIGLAVLPDPVPVDLVDPCAGVFAMFPCSAASYIRSQLTVSVATLDEIGGRGAVEIHAVDAATGQPLPAPAGSLLGELDVVLGPHASTAVPLEWKRPIPDAGPGRIPPAQLAFVATVQWTDNRGKHVSETVTVLERLPRTWQLF